MDLQTMPRVLPPPPVVRREGAGGAPVEPLRCDWSAHIWSYDEMMRFYRPRSRVLDIILIVCFLIGVALVVPLPFKQNDTTLGLSMCGGFGLFFMLIACLAALSAHRETIDLKRERSTQVYWKGTDLTKKREAFEGLMRTIPESTTLERRAGIQSKHDQMEYRYIFDNGNYISVKYGEVGSEWSNEGWVKIGYRYGTSEHARELQRKVDRWLSGTGAVTMKGEFKPFVKMFHR